MASLLDWKRCSLLASAGVLSLIATASAQAVVDGSSRTAAMNSAAMCIAAGTQAKASGQSNREADLATLMWMKIIDVIPGTDKERHGAVDRNRSEFDQGRPDAKTVEAFFKSRCLSEDEQKKFYVKWTMAAASEVH